MIVVRDVFRIHPERMKEATVLAREGKSLVSKSGFGMRRMLTDLTGDNYTMVFETEVADLQAWQQGMSTVFADPQWQAWYSRFRPLIAGGRREIFTLLE